MPGCPGAAVRAAPGIRAFARDRGAAVPMQPSAPVRSAALRALVS